MDYRETSAPPRLRHLAKASWTLSTPVGDGDWFNHVATPDGCVEIIRRVSGRSVWETEQPSCFVAGLITRPAELRLSGGASFIGLRLWPWAWAALAAPGSQILVDCWRDLATAAPHVELPGDPDMVFGLLDPHLLGPESLSMAHEILGARTVAEIAERSGRPHRSLQRWFKAHVGVPPRTYLRLLRFNQTFEGLAAADGTLAGHAADHGFADQSHMARDFRSLSGQPATRAKEKARGPFL